MYLEYAIGIQLYEVFELFPWTNNLAESLALYVEVTTRRNNSISNQK